MFRAPGPLHGGEFAALLSYSSQRSEEIREEKGFLEVWVSVKCLSRSVLNMRITRLYTVFPIKQG